MAGLKIGSLEVDIGIDTSGLKKAEVEVNRSTNKINKELETTERESRRVDRALEEVGKEATKTAEKFRFTAVTVKRVSGEWVRMNSAIKGVSTNFGIIDGKLTETNRKLDETTRKITATGKAANDAGRKGGKGFKLMGRSAGQAGIQIQQFVGQIQGGQNAFVALSQQSADLGFVLGAPLIGVFVSLAAVVGGVLFEAFTASSEVMERAATSASDLSDEYLKLTGQTKELAATKLSADMLEDAEAVVLLSKELRKLKDRRADLVASGAVLAPTLLRDFDREINDVDSRMQALIAKNEFRMRELNKFIVERRGEGTETDAPGGKGSTGGSTFDQIIQQEIAALQLRGQLFNDSNATIEAEIMRFELAALNLFEVGSEDFLAAEQALADKRVELRKAADDKISKQTEQASKKQALQLKSAQTAALSGMLQLGDQLNRALEQSGKEGTVIAKAVFLAQKAIQVVSILAATEVAAANAAAVAALGGPVAFFATQGAIRATGFASAGLVAGLSIGEGFADGGIVGGGSFTGDNISARVNSGEMILNAGQQAKLFNMANSGGSGGGSMPRITIINDPGVFTEIQSITESEVVMIARRESKRATDAVNTSLATGRGSSARSLQQGFKTPRNIK